MPPFKVAGKDVGEIGLGVIGLVAPGKAIPTDYAIEVLKTALDSGANFWNAGEFYGVTQYNSLHLLNAYFSKYPEDAARVFISVKGCFDMISRKALNDSEGVRASIDNCLKIIDGKCHIDLFEAARVDPDVPIETTVRAIAEYVKAGKVGSIGLSECSAASIRKAAAVHPVAAVELELSLFETSVLSNGVAETCQELQIPVIAYSPLGRGFLTGKFRRFEDLPDGDYRKFFPRFQPAVFGENLKVVEEVDELAKGKGCSAAQVAIAWVSEQSRTTGIPIIPIPGASAISRVQENMKRVTLRDQELKQLNLALQRITIKGARYPAAFARFVGV